MSEVISLKVSESTKKRMQIHDELNWSAVIRKYIEKKLDELEYPEIDVKLAEAAVRNMRKSRRKHKTVKGDLTSEELVRKWRDKRRF